MKIAVVSNPYLESEFVDESRMLKAALLYGDHVTLLRWDMGYAIISLLRDDGLQKLLPTDNPLLKQFLGKKKNENIFLRVEQIVEEAMSSHDLEKFIDAAIVDEQIPADVRGDLEFYRATPGDTKDQTALARRSQIFEHVRDVYWQAVRNNMSDSYANALDAQNQRLVRATQNKLLEVKDYPMFTDGQTPRTSDFGPDLLNALTNGAFPMLPDMFGRVLNEISKLIKEAERPLGQPELTRMKELLVAEGLFGRLPLFEDASLDQILDIRSDLQPYLIPFRSAVISFSEQIAEAPWSEEFAFEVEQRFRREVTPAIQAIEDEVKSRTYLWELASKAIKDQTILASAGGLAVGLTQLSSLPSIISQSLTVGSAVGGALAVTRIGLDAFLEWREKRVDLQRKQLYFLYRAGDLLSQPTRRRKRPRLAESGAI